MGGGGDWDKGLEGGREDGAQRGRMRERGVLPFQIWNRIELIYWSWTLWGGGRDGRGSAGRMGIQD